MSDPYELVRVKDNTTRHEYTTERRFVVDGLTVLDKPAAAPSGKPLPPKYHSPLGTPAPGSKQERRRQTAKKAAAKKAAAPKDTGAKGSGTDAGQTSADPTKEK